MHISSSLMACCFLLWLPMGATTAHAEYATGEKGMIATVHPLASEAGHAAFEQGGNAVDAAITAALTLGVVDNHNSGIGGGCFILLRLADGSLHAIDGREMAPAASRPDMYLVDGRPDTSLSQVGALASGVPGALAAYDLALRKFGNRSLADALAPGQNRAEAGFPINRATANAIRSKRSQLAEFAGSRAVLLKPDGSPYTEGEVLVQKDLARTYQMTAEHGINWFYRGEFARKTARWMKSHGGIMTVADFENYRPVEREPIQSKYRGYSIVGFPPPSSGGVHVAQMLNILEAFDLKRIHDENEAEFVHVVAEAMKLAFVDRAHWLGDPDFAKVPRGLIAPAYGLHLATRIDMNQATVVPERGLPPGYDTDFFGKHTTHIAAADAQGNWVAITATVNTTFGSKVIVPGLGVVMNNEMDDFSIAPGVPNAFGLVGAEANAVAPLKRPLSSMSPTLVLKEGQPVMTVGAAGGPKIITEVLLAIIRHLDLDMPIDEAVNAPRFHHQWAPDVLLMESTTPQELRRKVEGYGHQTKMSSVVGITQAIGVSPDGKSLQGVHDGRTQGKALGH